MAKYLLDTNIVMYLEDKTLPQYTTLQEQAALLLSNNDEVYLPLLVLHELHYWVASARPEIKERFSAVLTSIKNRFPVLPLTEKGADAFGVLKAKYKKQTGINKKFLERHNVDFILASSAVAENAILVSNDKLFKTLAEMHTDFRCENWTISDDE